MTMQEFHHFEQMTYDFLAQLKPFLGDYIRRWGPLDIRSVRETADAYVACGGLPGITLPEEFDDNLFNFITDDEFACWIEREGIGSAWERTGFDIYPPPQEGEL